MLAETLKKLGLSGKEIVVYTTVLTHGRLRFTDISKITKLNRTTVYSVAHELLARGLLQEDLATSVKALVPTSPEALNTFVLKEEARVQEKKKLIAEAINDIRALPSTAGYVAPVITYIPEERINTYMHEHAPKWNESMLQTDKIWWGFQDASFVLQYADWIEWYWTIAPAALTLKLFSNDTAIEREIQTRTPSRREIRYWKGEETFTGTLWITGDYVININTHVSPFSLVETHDRVLAQNLRTVFAKLWEEDMLVD